MKQASSIKHVFVLSLISLSIIGIVTFGLLVVREGFLVARLEGKIAQLRPASIPLRFQVLSRGGETVSARFSFYDMDGTETAVFERSWNGTELEVESLIVPVSGSYLVFPSRVFTDTTAPGRGTELFTYYDQDGFPTIFGSAKLDRQTRSALVELFTEVKIFGRSDPPRKARLLANLFRLRSYAGNAVYDTKRLRGFELGAVYALVAKSDGKIEIIRE